MGMNPETRQFEHLDNPEALERAYAKSWKVFKIGEKVTIKETDFAVQDISPNKLVLRPYGSTEVYSQSAAVDALAKKIEGLTGAEVRGIGIGWAIKQMHNGSKVRRAGWNGKGMWLGYVPGDQWGLGSGQNVFDYGAAGPGKLLPWIGMRTAQGDFVPWLASQTDLLATDWETAD